MSILIKNGRVIDAAAGISDAMDVLIEGKFISKVSKDIKAQADIVIDALGKFVLPGLIDMHVHLREPGREDKETVASGTKAALKGGVTSVLAMPNTAPVMDTFEHMQLLKGIIQKTAVANVYVCGAITIGRQGKELSDIAALKSQGAVAITDDGNSVDDEGLMREAFKKAKEADVLVICHCEDKKLSAQGVINLGFVSTQLGLRGISRESEYKRVERDLKLAKEAGSRVHIAHISCRESVELVRSAKKSGLAVTAETAPHYFSLVEDALMGYDTNLKINPPLRGVSDCLAIKDGLKDNTIDCIASDHAPHTENEKEIEFDRAAFGVVGLETELSVAITELVDKGILDWPGLVEKMAAKPARILGLNKGRIAAGSDADIIIVDPQKEWVVAKDIFVSKSKNSAFLGRTLKGVVEYTICAGLIAYRKTNE
ncbi:MAG: dihydroorotase [Candidatus Omnitrophota bacterium]